VDESALSPPPLEDSTSSDNDVGVASPSQPQGCKNKRNPSKNDTNRFEKRRRQQQNLSQHQIEFYIDQMIQMANQLPKYENIRKRIAILITITCLEKGTGEKVNITEVRRKMFDYPDILPHIDYSYIQDEKKRKEKEDHFIRNPNQGLKSFMKKQGNKVQLTDDITLLLSPTKKGTREGIFYSVEIKNL
jgi:hypothetical protein